VTTVKKSVLIVVLFAACAAQTQSLKMISVRFPAIGSTPNSIQFLCSQTLFTPAIYGQPTSPLSAIQA